jgi:hypothetical protein
MFGYDFHVEELYDGGERVANCPEETIHCFLTLLFIFLL